MAGAEPIPWPGSPPSPLPGLADESIAESWRLHWETDPTIERRYPAGRYRFDAPAAQFGVTYVSDDRLAVFAETYAEGTRVLAKSEADRMLSKLWSTRPLKLLRMDDMAVAAAFDLDNRISTEKPYDRTQAWSLAWHTWYPDLDGVRFLGRKSAPHANVCLYLDRCSGAVAFENDNTLVNLRRDGLVACRRYNIAPLLYA
jgi:RES domain-containing protein